MTKEEMYEIYLKVQNQKYLNDAKYHVDEYIQTFIKEKLDYNAIVNQFIEKDDGYVGVEFLWRDIIEEQIKDLFE